MYRPNVRMEVDDILMARLITRYEVLRMPGKWDKEVIGWLLVGVLLTVAMVLAALPPL